MPELLNLERYNRNILISEVGEEGQKKLLNARVLVAGTGGLGATVISVLSSVGIGTIGLVDNDKLELSNLNRQFVHKFRNIDKLKVDSAEEWIKSYNPDIKVKTYPVRLNKDNHSDILKGYDIVVDCFDSYESKFLLNDACMKNDKILIHAGVAEFYGQVLTIIPGETACLGCLFPNQNPPSVLKGVISPAVSTIASIQSMEVIKVILNVGNLLTDELLTYNGLRQEFKKIKLTKNKICPICSQNHFHLDKVFGMPYTLR